ncbi:hypothetical protein [Salinispora arenicola]|uniref:hypothetical protein n=1 Tax=Salinispora arenicola TaxID=168697 RepID=UPI000305C526|nr:hypothetical protein [Salinispora arenicola]
MRWFGPMFRLSYPPCGPPDEPTRDRGTLVNRPLVPVHVRSVAHPRPGDPATTDERTEAT